MSAAAESSSVTAGPSRGGAEQMPSMRFAKPHLLCLLLSALLAWMPVAAQASGLSCCTSDDAHATMPCHGSAAPRLGDETSPDCDHCATDASTCQCGSQCQCLEPAVSATIPSLESIVCTVSGAKHTVLGMVTDALPDGPGERLFRPPIR
jgi:hypothetical protein